MRGGDGSSPDLNNVQHVEDCNYYIFFVAASPQLPHSMASSFADAAQAVPDIAFAIPICIKECLCAILNVFTARAVLRLVRPSIVRRRTVFTMY